jgi:hypothetical protein
VRVGCGRKHDGKGGERKREGERGVMDEEGGGGGGLILFFLVY